MTLTNLIPTLQLAIGPAILISGVGLLLLSITNRFGRVIDQSRQLTHDLPSIAAVDRDKVLAEVRVALLIISLFTGMLLMLDAVVPAGLFIQCMICLIGALLMFFWDINLSLNALRLEVPEIGARLHGSP